MWMPEFAGFRRLLVLTAAYGFVINGVSAGEELPAPHRRVIVGHGFGQQPIPKWESGFLLARDESIPTVYVFDRDGRRLWTSTLQVPNSARVSPRGLAAWADGTVVVSGGAVSNDGALAGFIAWFGPSGAVQKIVRTSPFVAWLFCPTDEGTLWALGRTLAVPGSKEEPPHDILRQYDRNGRFLRSALPRSTFDGQRHPVPGAFMGAAKGRLGLYVSATHEWIELSAQSGETLGRSKYPLAGSAKITGLAFTGSSIYISGMQPGGAGSVARAFFSKLDRTKGQWLPIETGNLASGNASPFILGVDSTSLVVGTSLPEISWVAVEH